MPTIDVHEASLFYEDTGGSGEPILFIHGLFLASESFEAQREALRQTHRVVTFDLRGQGRSQKTRDRLSMDDLAEDAMELMRKLELGPCHIVAFSMGTFVALRIAARRPDLVRSLTLIGPSADAEDPARMRRYTSMIAFVRFFGPRPLTGSFIKILFGKTFLAAPSRAAERERWRRVLVGLPRSLRFAAAGSAHRTEIASELSAITVPTLVVSGEEDLPIPPATARRVQQAIPRARFVSLPETGHAVMIERPREFNALLSEFLASLAPPSPHQPLA